MKLTAIIGKNFGDEGKGLAADYFSMMAQKSGERCLVVRHNGGAQAGHTVDLPDKRFVFHQLSSGSFRSADTLWADTFLPDLFKLREETEEFLSTGSPLPKIYGYLECRCVMIDDVLINMALETSRGNSRHGSCGMGINECVLRSETEYALPLKKILSLSCEELYHELGRIRKEYIPKRLRELSLSWNGLGEYGELLGSANVLYNAAEEMKRAESLIIPVNEPPENYDTIVFEGAQGLLLDELNEEFAPHLTSSRTGICNPAEFRRKYFPDQKLEAVYVTRSYVTRHGAGYLPHEGLFDRELYPVTDKTNIPNEWQGRMRFAVHGTPKEFSAPVINDISQNENIIPSLFITHLNETHGNICTSGGDISLLHFCREYEIHDIFSSVFYSSSPFADETHTLGNKTRGSKQ